MIIGVGNDQFTWMYGMEFGVPRALGGIHVRVPNVAMQGWVLRRLGEMFRRSNSRFFHSPGFFDDTRIDQSLALWIYDETALVRQDVLQAGVAGGTDQDSDGNVCSTSSSNLVYFSKLRLRHFRQDQG